MKIEKITLSEKDKENLENIHQRVIDSFGIPIDLIKKEWERKDLEKAKGGEEMEKRVCEECGGTSEYIHLTCIECNGVIRRVHLCEKCHEKYEKPFKKE